MDANPERGEVTLVIPAKADANGEVLSGERRYIFKLSVNAAVALESKLKKTIAEILGEASTLNFASIRDLVFVLLQKYHASEFNTLAKAGDLIDDAGGVKVFFDALQSLNEANAPTVKGGDENPPITQGGAGDDSTLSPVASA